MTRDERGFWIFDLPMLSKSAMDEFETLPLDKYTPGGHRFRRYSTFRVSSNAEGWHLEQQPQRPFFQPKSYNNLVGGVAREFAPVRIDPTPQIIATCDAVGLDRAHDYSINLHQIRIITDKDTEGVLVPEGPHRDGHAMVLTAVFRRHNVSGGVSKLYPVGEGDAFFSTQLEPGQAMMIEDERMWHHATDITSLDGSLGFRDIWIVSFNRWEDRRYGAAFERRSLAQT